MVGMLASALLAGLFPQDPPPPVSGVDEVKVDQAIKKGIEFLRRSKSPDFHEGYRNSDELILWTFIHAGVPQQVMLLHVTQFDDAHSSAPCGFR